MIELVVYCRATNPTGRRLSPRSIRGFCQINNRGRNCKLTSKETRIKLCQFVSEVC